VKLNRQQRRAARPDHERSARKRELSDREQMLERFGRDAEERQHDRRKPQTPAERDRVLRDLGIEDRRRGDRRRR
jgi:hypothetical protein